MSYNGKEKKTNQIKEKLKVKENEVVEKLKRNFVPKLHPTKKPKRIPSPIKLNDNLESLKRSSIIVPNNEEDLFSLDICEQNKKEASFNLSLSSCSSDSEGEDIVNHELYTTIDTLDQYRRMLKNEKSKTVLVKPKEDSEILLVNEKYIKEYSELTSKILVPVKKNSCLYPSNNNQLQFGEQIMENTNNKKRERGYSILDILELYCNGKNNS